MAIANVNVVLRKLPRASFAPPLTDEKLSRYESLIQALPVGEIKDAMLACLDCVKAWWELPESKAKTSKWRYIRKGQEIEVTETPLEQKLIDALWDATPYLRECESMHAMFLGMQAGENHRNAEKMQAWQDAIRNHLISEAYTPEERAWLYSEDRKIVRALLVALGGFQSGDKHIDSVIAAVAPGKSRATFSDEAAKMKAVDAKATAIANGESESPIPRPQLESAELRHAAMELLWYTQEIALDREPVTADKL